MSERTQLRIALVFSTVITVFSYLNLSRAREAEAQLEIETARYQQALSQCMGLGDLRSPIDLPMLWFQREKIRPLFESEDKKGGAATPPERK